MGDKTIQILSTRPVDENIITKAAAMNIRVDMLSFIETIAIADPFTINSIKELSYQNCLVIFTSMNAAEMVGENLHGRKPSWKIGCMGNSTSQIVAKYFGESSIVATGINATDLAKKVLTWRYAAGDSNAIVFFCGDQRREELPAIFSKQNLALQEIVTYQTIEKHHVLNQTYDAVLFFSPSAVHSFFTCNHLQNESTCFAIGDTTANAIKTYHSGDIIISDFPSKNALLEEAIAFFQKRYS